MKNIIINTLSTFLIVGHCTMVFSQVPVPAEPQNEPILLVGGTAHIGDGTIIENAMIGFKDGEITVVSKESEFDGRSEYEIIDVSGHHVYPGFILPNSQVGLEEVSAVRAMSDYNEQGSFNPNVRSLIAYNTDSEIPPTLRFNGILLAEATPLGGVVSGTSSVMEMDGWNWEDAVHSADVAIHMNWPNRMNRRFDPNTFTFRLEENSNYEKNVEELNMHFKEAVSYNTLQEKPLNLKLESMQGLFDGTQVLIIHVSGLKEIVESVKFLQNQNVNRIALVTDEAAWYAREFIKENNIPVILPPTHSRPSRVDDDYDLPYKLPYLLHKEGIMVALSHSGMLANSRNLPFYAGTAAAYGLSREEALMTITSNTAEILGISKRVGTLASGKEATLFVSKGDALDIRTNALSHAFIRGKKIILDNRQQELYRRYSKKYGHVD